MFGEKVRNCQNWRGSNQNEQAPYLSYIDTHMVGALIEDQRQTVRMCVNLYRMWLLGHKMISNETEKRYSLSKGDIYRANLVQEYRLYKSMQRDYTVNLKDILKEM